MQGKKGATPGKEVIQIGCIFIVGQESRSKVIERRIMCSCSTVHVGLYLRCIPVC